MPTSREREEKRLIRPRDNNSRTIKNTDNNK